jgi:hypothetical protein
MRLRVGKMKITNLSVIGGILCYAAVFTGAVLAIAKR